MIQTVGLIFAAALFSTPSGALGAICELIAPIDSGATDPEFGLIFVPGADIAGEAYRY